MNKSESIKELATALAKAQSQLRPAVKDSVNPYFKSKYADLGAVWEACREALTGNGLSVVQMPTDSTEGRVGLTTILLHTSGEYISSEVSTRLKTDDAQGVGSALTYLRRYALAAFVGIVADEDDDGQAASRPQQQQSQSQQQRQQQPANGNGQSASGKASEKQIKMLFAIWHKHGFEGKLQDWIKNTYRCEVDALSMKDASAAIETLEQPVE